MLGLRYFVCQRCETAFALPEPPAQCGRCGHDQCSQITDGGGAAAYFAPVGSR